MVEIRWARSVCAYSSTVYRGRVAELSDRYSTGWSAGFTFWYVGGVGISGGRSGSTFVIAACTSCAAASMLRSSANWIVICVSPSALDEVIESMPAIVVNCFSSGVATAEAMVSGLAPGSAAVTWTVGKSTFGRSLTGRRR